MSLKKTAAIAAAAGALTALAMPAMAFENEFHGTFTSRFILSSYDNGGVTAVNPSAYNEKNKANNYIEQRARLQYIAKASDDLKLVTHFELDTKFGGDKTGKYGVSSDAGVYDGDGINLETKHVYLDFNLGKSVNVKTGLLPYKDAFKGIFFDVDATGVLVTAKMAPLTLSVAGFRVATDSSLAANNTMTATATTLGVPFNTVNTPTYFGATSQIGHNNKDIFMLDGKFAVTKDMNLGAAYYLMSDYTSPSTTTVHLFGLNADAKFGPATLSGFFVAEAGATGSGTSRKSVSGYSGNLAAKMAIGPGTLRTAGLFLSGDGDTNKHNTSFLNSGFQTYGESNLWIFARTGAGGTSSDRTIPGVAGPGAKGQWLYTLGYDATITPKMFANANVGFSWVAKNLGSVVVDKATGKQNATNFQGTEINLETGYKIYDNMTAKVQVAYAILGGYYKGTSADVTAVKDPENPYSARIAWSYAF